MTFFVPRVVLAMRVASSSSAWSRATPRRYTVPSCVSTLRLRPRTSPSAASRARTLFSSHPSLTLRDSPCASPTRSSLPTSEMLGALQAIRSASTRSSIRGTRPDRTITPSAASTSTPPSSKPCARSIRARTARPALASWSVRTTDFSSPDLSAAEPSAHPDTATVRARTERKRVMPSPAPPGLAPG